MDQDSFESSNVEEDHEEEVEPGKELLKARKAAVLAVTKAPTAGLRTKAYGKSYKKLDSWNMLKLRLISAKMKNSLASHCMEIRGKEYTILRKLGEGGFSKVYLAYNEDKRLVVVKVVSLVTVEGTEDSKLLGELAILRNLRDV